MIVPLQWQNMSSSSDGTKCNIMGPPSYTWITTGVSMMTHAEATPSS